MGPPLTEECQSQRYIHIIKLPFNTCPGIYQTKF
jgi:hypothetical protein